MNLNKLIRIALISLGVGILLLGAINLGLYFYIKTHKKELLSKVNEKLSESINGNFSVKDLSYTFSANINHAKINLKGIKITDSLYEVHKIPTLEVENAKISLQLLDLTRKNLNIKELSLENGKFNLFTLKNAYTNNYFFQKKKKAATSSDEMQLNLSKIKLTNIKFHQFDQIRGKDFDFDIHSLKTKVDKNGEIYKLNTDLETKVNALITNPENGSFLKNSLVSTSPKIQYDPKTKKLSWDETRFTINEEQLRIGGYFAINQPTTFELNIVSEKTNFANISQLLAKNIQVALSRFKVEGNFFVKGKIKGLKDLNTQVRLDFELKDNKAVTPWFEINDLSTKGYFYNQVNPNIGCTDENTTIVFENTSGKVNGAKVTSRLTKIKDFVNPYLQLDLKANGESKSLNSIIQNNQFLVTDGAFNLAMTINGFLQDNRPAPNFDGEMTLKNTHLQLAKKQGNKVKFDGKLLFKKHQLQLQNLRSEYVGNIFLVNGTIDHFAPYLLNDQTKIASNLHIKSKNLKLEKYLYLINYLGDNANKKSASTADSWTAIYGNPQKITLDIDEISYRKLKAKKLNANLVFDYPVIRCDDLSLSYGNGNIKLSSKMTENLRNRYSISSVIDVNNIKTQDFLASFNYFDVDALRKSEIKGNLDIKTLLDIQVDANGTLIDRSVNGKMFFNLKNGSFVNFQPMGKVFELVFSKNRFRDIKFSSIKNEVTITNGNVKIPEMEIQNTALDFYLSGNFSLSNETDMMASIPLRNVFSRDQKLSKKSARKDTGKNIFVKIVDTKDGKTLYKVYTNKENAQDNKKIKSQNEKKKRISIF